jgi:hypothetical protein
VVTGGKNFAGLTRARQYNAAHSREGRRSQETRTQECNMKRAVRMMILMVGLVCTYVAVATPFVHAEGPAPLCNPKRPCPPK